GTTNKPLTIISEQDITLQGSGKSVRLTGDPTDPTTDVFTEFKATGTTTKGRPNILALIAGCDIHINYTLSPITSPVPWSETARPKEPDPPAYPNQDWSKIGHIHYYADTITVGWGTTIYTGSSIGSVSMDDLPCPPGQDVGACNENGVNVSGCGFINSWWRSGCTPIDEGTFSIRITVWSKFDDDTKRYENSSAYRQYLNDLNDYRSDPSVLNCETYTDPDDVEDCKSGLSLTEPSEPCCRPNQPPYPKPVDMNGTSCGVPTDDYFHSSFGKTYDLTDSTNSSFYGSTAYWNRPGPGSTWSCSKLGISLTARLQEFHETQWQFDGYTPGMPYSGNPPAGPPSYPHGITRGSGSPYSQVETDVDAADDTYCLDWSRDWQHKSWRSPIGLIPGSVHSGSDGWDPGSSASPQPPGETPDESDHYRSEVHPPVPYLGDFHPDYTPGTDNLKTGLATRKAYDSVLDYAPSGGYASSNWGEANMVDPTPLHELCDFMSFKLTNVALLAPAGGLIADQWFLPRRNNMDPRIEINGSMTVRHRGLFARSDTNGNLTTGYRKHFTHPTGFEQGTTTWWPDIKQNHWTPQP
ncbi:MAG: hypothetical protein OXI96_10625, partial [Acidimicrobiaceae bacterium]|nr:hypothetical protein [Acidimicrobiaceae bacterium]